MSPFDPSRPVSTFQPNTLPDAEAFVSLLMDNAACPEGTEAEAYRYAVCQCFDTFVWGQRIQGVWEWASDPTVGAGVRPPDKRTLIEARVFGPTEETLVWRDSAAGSADFHGRVVKDSEGMVYLKRYASFQPAQDDQNPQNDYTEASRISNTKHKAFVQRRLGNGRITVTPEGTGVLIYEYLQEQTETGAVRIFLTRFVDILKETTDLHGGAEERTE
jgi:hypothetical protein